MEYQKDIEILPVPKTPDLKPSTEEQHWFWALTFVDEIVMQVVKKMGESPSSPVHAFINTLDTESELESEQSPLTPDMSPIIRPEIEPLEVPMPCSSMSETNLNIVKDKTQDSILEFLINTSEIYLVQERGATISSKQKYGKGSKRNKLKAPYKGRRGKVESKTISLGELIHYNQPNQSLFYKEMMAKVKKTTTHAEKSLNG